MHISCMHIFAEYLQHKHWIKFRVRFKKDITGVLDQSRLFCMGQRCIWLLPTERWPPVNSMFTSVHVGSIDLRQRQESGWFVNKQGIVGTKWDFGIIEYDTDVVHIAKFKQHWWCSIQLPCQLTLVLKNLTLAMKECESLSLVLAAQNEFKLCT